MEELAQLGLGLTAAILVIREVLTFLRERRHNQRNGDVDLRQIAQEVKDLHQWHSITDGEGVKVWYVRRSLEDAIRELSKSFRAQTEVLQGVVTETRETRRDIERAIQ